MVDFDAAPPKPRDDLGAGPAKMGDDARDALLKQIQLGQQLKSSERGAPTVLDLAAETTYSAIYSGVQTPLTSVGQIADKVLDSKTNIAGMLTKMPAPQHEDFGTARWHAQQLGGGIGMIAPFMLTKGALNKSGLSFAAKTEAGVLASSKLMSTANAGLIADGAIAGFAYDFALRPVEQKDMGRFWAARTDHGLTGAATFGTLTAGSVGLRHLTRPLASTLVGAPKVGKMAYDFTMGAVPGIPAGIVNADVNARLTEGRWATNTERAQGAYTMFMAGGTLSALHSIPGSEVPIGDVAKAYASKRAGINNLNEMLAERARAAKTAGVEAKTGTDGTVATTASGGDVRLVGALKPASAADVVKGPAEAKPTTEAKPPVESKPAVESGKAKGTDGDGRVMKSSDVPEGVAKPVEAEFVVPKELTETFQRGVDLAFNGSDVNATPQQVADFFRYARGEGAPLKQQMMEVAKSYADDPRMMTLIREAYLPAEGVEHRVVQGDIKLKTPNATTDMYARWGQFMNIVEKMPQDVDGYVGFRHDVFRWLNENKDMHDWARQYGEQNRYSKVAGPLDFYFGTSNLTRFVEVADAQAATRAATRVEGSQAKATVDGGPKIRLDLTAEQAKAGQPNPTEGAGLPLLGVEALKFAGKPTPEKAPLLDIAAERPAGPAYGSMEQKMAAFEKAGPTRQKIDALALSEKFGEMTTEQFAKWLDYAYAKPAGATNDGASNIKSMWISNREALLSPEVTEAYKQYRGFGEAPAEGQPPAVPLETIRQFLSAPKAEARPVPEWMQVYIGARVEQAMQRATPESQPHQILNDALPRWVTEGLRQQHVTDAKIAGKPPTYSENLPPELAQWLEAARQTEPVEKRDPKDKRPPRDNKPPNNDVNFRFGKLEEILKVEDPTIRENLLRLGQMDHTALRAITSKLDPARSAPEYMDLFRMVLPKAEHPNDVKILLDAIFNGNKANRESRGSEATKANQQLAMAAAEHLVPQSDPNFDVVQKMVNDMLVGNIRDPFVPRDGQGGRPGGKPGEAPKKDGSALVGQVPDQPGARAPRVVAPPRAPQEVVVREVVPGSGVAKPPAAEAPPVVEAKPPAAEAPPVVEAKPPAAEPKPVVEAPPVVEAKPPAAEPKPVVEAPPVVEAKPPAAEPKPVVEAPPVVEAKPPAAEPKPVVEAPPVVEAKPPAAEPKPVVEAPPVVEAKPPVETEARTVDVSTLRNGQNIKIGDQRAVFVGKDAHSGEAIVRVLGENKWVEETFYNSKQYAKIVGKMQLQEVVVDRSAGDRRQHIYRDGEGKFWEIHAHGSGYMVTEVPEYRVVKPGDIIPR